MIEAHCRTNIDGYQMEKWPTQFVALPRLGDSVQSENGNVLRVVEVTHAMKEEKAIGAHTGCTITKSEPYVKVELHNMD